LMAVIEDVTITGVVILPNACSWYGQANGKGNDYCKKSIQYRDEVSHYLSSSIIAIFVPPGFS